MSKWPNSQRYSFQNKRKPSWREQQKSNYGNKKQEKIGLWLNMLVQECKALMGIDKENLHNHILFHYIVKILLEFFSSRTRSTNGFLFCLKSGPLKKFSFAKSTFPLTSGIHLLKTKKLLLLMIIRVQKGALFCTIC